MFASPQRFVSLGLARTDLPSCMLTGRERSARTQLSLMSLEGADRGEWCKSYDRPAAMTGPRI